MCWRSWISEAVLKGGNSVILFLLWGSKQYLHIILSRTQVSMCVTRFREHHFMLRRQRDRFHYWRNQVVCCMNWKNLAGQLETVEFLISYSADLNAEDVFKNTCLNDAVRHRYICCITENPAIAQMLVDQARQCCTVSSWKRSQTCHGREKCWYSHV